MEGTLIQITDYLLTQSWQIALLVAVVAMVNLVLRNRSAHVRYLLWLIVLAKCLMPPLLTVPLAVLPQDESVPMPILERTVAPETVPAPMPLRPVRRALPEQTVAPKSARLHFRQWFALVWMGGVAALIFIAAFKALRTQLWLKRERKPLPADLHVGIADLFSSLGLKRFPKIWLVEGIGQPFVWGLLRGGIYLPAGFIKVHNVEHRRGVLGHELSHVLRFDAAVNLLQTIAQAVFWFHPFVWWANKKIRAEREKCCDEMTIARLNTRVRDYSKAIVDTLVNEYESTRPVPSLAIVGPVKNIEERIKTMLRPGRKFYIRPSLMVAIVVVLIAILTVPTALVLTARAETETAVQSDQGHLQGMWIGNELGPTAGKCKITISGKQIRFQAESGEWYKGTFTLREKAEPKQLDFVIEDGLVPVLIGKISKVIYKVENETLTFAANAPGEEVRPASFNESSGGRVFVLTKGQAPQTEPTLSLHNAAATGDLEQVKLHISKDADVNAKDNRSRTALHRAAHSGHIEVVRVLLEHGADVNAEDKFERTPLEHAAVASRTQVVKLLIEKGASLNACNQWGKTPLHVAAHSARKDTVEALIAKGADVTIRGTYGLTPLYFAMLTPVPGRKEVVELIVATGKEPSTIHLAAYLGDLGEVKTFMKEGIDVNAKGPGDGTALHFAAAGRQKEVMEFLLAQGADVNARAAEDLTPLHAAVFCSSDKEAIELLIAKGADVNAYANIEGEMRMSVLGMWFAQCLMQAMEGYGAEDLDKDQEIARVWNSDVTQLLLSKGAKVGDGIWLSIAAAMGISKIVELAINQGADVNAEDWDGSTLLHRAAESGQKKMAEQLLTKGADVNAKNKDGQTPLHLSVRQGHRDIAELLLTNGSADVNAKNKWDRTPMDIAVDRGQRQIIELLSRHGARILTSEGVTALHEAAAVGDISLVKSLISKGAGVNAKDEDGRTPLHQACLYGHMDVAEFLIAGGADINATDDLWGARPLGLAAYEGHKGTVKLLLSKGTDVEHGNKWGNTALSEAAHRGNMAVARLLLASGVEVDGKNHYDQTPLQRAVESGHEDMVELLLANGADINATRFGETALHRAMIMNKPEMVSFLLSKGLATLSINSAAYFAELGKVKDLVARGAYINSKDTCGYSPLYCAVCGECLEVLEFLIAKGADVNVKDERGFTPLHQASWNGHRDITGLLIAKGAVVNAKAQFGSTPLYLASYEGHAEVVRLLLDRGADVNATHRDRENEPDGNWKPLHMACRNGHKAVTELLMTHGADINARTKKGLTALSLAQEKGHKEIIDLLRKHGATQ